jgi:hypothetical protein
MIAQPNRPQTTIKTRVNAWIALVDLANRPDIIPGIVSAMAKCGHRWHDTPPGETPSADDVHSVLFRLIDCLNEQLRQNPDHDHTTAATGGINVTFTRWPSGGEQVEIFYAPVQGFATV